MKNLRDDELMKIDGGGFNLSIASLVVASVTFFIGILDGIVRPLKCN